MAVPVFPVVILLSAPSLCPLPQPQPCEAEPETFVALVACPLCQLPAGPGHPKQPLSPLPAHPLVFLDGVSPLSLPHHELFSSQEQGAVAWAGGVGDTGVRTGRSSLGGEMWQGGEVHSVLSCLIASHPIWRLKVQIDLCGCCTAPASSDPTTPQPSTDPKLSGQHCCDSHPSVTTDPWSAPCDGDQGMGAAHRTTGEFRG